MREQVERHYGFLKTTAIGGVVFLLPLIVVGALLAQAGQIVWSIVDSVREFLADPKNEAVAAYVKFDHPATYALLVAASIAVVVAACFFCGMLARRSIGRWFSERAERYLTMLFPRYAVFKDQLTGNLGGGSLRPVLAQVGGATRVGMEVERDAEGRVTVYLPHAPDPWTGTVAILAEADVTPISGEVGDVMATFEQLGRGTARLARGHKP